MGQVLPGPERQKWLKAVIEGCARAERRIIFGQRRAWGGGPDLSRYSLQRPLIEHIAAVYIRRGAVKYTESLMALRMKRSRLQAELKGLEWHC